MKYNCFLFLTFLMFSAKLNAQQDSLPKTDSLNNTLPADSATAPAVTVILDSSRLVHSCLIGPYDFHPEFLKYYIVESFYKPKGARRDIRKGKPLILFPGGIISRTPDSEKDRAFEKKYGVTFRSRGCLQAYDDDEEGYNRVIFDYLDKKYGKAWRYELRDDAIGFDAPEPRPVVPEIKEASILPLQTANTETPEPETLNPETEVSVWWYILPTSGFALLLSLYFIKRKKD